jgi:adenine-specific DNA-methyltransferase
MNFQPKHLNYIGSKHSLLDWLSATILEKTGYSSFEGKRIADLFGGTGVVSFHFRTQGASILSNDIEPCSYIVTKGMTEGVYTPRIKEILALLNEELEKSAYKETVGFMTKHYSPYEGCERMFFTVDNAKRMDYIRKRILEVSVSEEERAFLLASLVVSADTVANCASVYGAYLKEFKKVALKPLVLQPIHQCSLPATSKTTTSDVLNQEFLQTIDADIVYLDPPYNERQYSKNYFPLSVLTFTPSEQETQILTGKTGIPALCFTSPFCSKRLVANAFQQLIQGLKAKWIFLSYNSESLLEKDAMLEILKREGTVTVLEKPYKRFKSSNKQENNEIKEYLFCLERV